jgi:hypothetical protein
MTRTALVDEDELRVGAEAAILGAISRPARSRGLALRVGRVDTLARPAGEIITMNAVRIILRRGGVYAGQEDNCRCYEGKKSDTHVSLLR